MMVGKRKARPPMKRTTSMTEFTLDEYQPSDHQPSPRPVVLNRRNSGDFVETANFLRVCSICKRRLTPARDIYMYKGDSAFCSLECRHEQMNKDDTKEKCSVAPSNKEHQHSTVTPFL